MEFRRATSKDVAALIELRKQQLLDEGQQPLQSIDLHLREYFEQSLAEGTLIVWIASEGDRIVATSGLCFYRLPPHYANPSGMIAYVTNMFTLKTHRRQGIATALLERILNEARLLGFSGVRLHASSDGRKLYAKFGFLPSDGYMALRF